MGGQRYTPAALPPGKTRYPLYRRLGGPQGRSGRMRKIPTPPGFDLWTVQPVASRYTDWATPAPSKNWVVLFFFFLFLYYTSLYDCDSTSIHESQYVDLSKVIVDYSLIGE